MKILLLAAGEGRRLRPLTDSKPKCLLPVLGKPILSYWLEQAQAIDNDGIYVNTHDRSEEVRVFLKENYADSGGIQVLHEEKLLGTAGTLKKLYQDSPDDVLAIHVDNFSNLKLEVFVKYFQSQPLPSSCIALFETVNFRSSGMMEFDQNLTVTSYIHKPSVSKTKFANAGVFLFTKGDLEMVFQAKTQLIDISQDVIPMLLGRMKGFLIEGIHLDIGTDLETYNNIDNIISLSGHPK